MILLAALGLAAQLAAGAFPTYGARRRHESHRRRRREVRLPRPHGYQQPILASRARRKVLAAGRRWGKSTTALTACLVGHGPKVRRRVGDRVELQPMFRGALQGGLVWWVVPDYPTSGRARWRQLKKACRGAWTYKNESELRLEFPGGGALQIRTADDPDSLRGEGLDGVVLDEAAFMPEVVWTEVLRAALSDKRGWAIFISTPKGRANWFWWLWLRGLDDATLANLRDRRLLIDTADPRRTGWESWQRPSSENPLLTGSELDDARDDLGSVLFAQEYLAEFTALAGALLKRTWFRYYDTLPDGSYQVEADTPHTVRPGQLVRKFATVDLAVSTKTSADYTVIATLGLTSQGELLLLDLRRARIEGPDVVPELKGAHALWRHAYQLIESTAYQLSVVQHARRAGLPVLELKAERDKVSRALTLAAWLEGGRFFFPRWAAWLVDLEAELEQFSADLSHDHDDQVDALAYAAIDASRATGRQMVEH